MASARRMAPRLLSWLIAATAGGYQVLRDRNCGRKVTAAGLRGRGSDVDPGVAGMLSNSAAAVLQGVDVRYVARPRLRQSRTLPDPVPVALFPIITTIAEKPPTTHAPNTIVICPIAILTPKIRPPTTKGVRRPATRHRAGRYNPRRKSQDHPTATAVKAMNR
jgi:hypothetical protein